MRDTLTLRMGKQEHQRLERWVKRHGCETEHCTCHLDLAQLIRYRQLAKQLEQARNAPRYARPAPHFPGRFVNFTQPRLPGHYGG